MTEISSVMHEPWTFDVPADSYVPGSDRPESYRVDIRVTFPRWPANGQCGCEDFEFRCSPKLYQHELSAAEKEAVREKAAEEGHPEPDLRPSPWRCKHIDRARKFFCERDGVEADELDAMLIEANDIEPDGHPRPHERA